MKKKQSCNKTVSLLFCMQLLQMMAISQMHLDEHLLQHLPLHFSHSKEHKLQ